MDTPLTRAEHEEFRRAVDAEHKRIHHRLDSMEKATEQIGSLAVSVEKLAVSMETVSYTHLDVYKRQHLMLRLAVLKLQIRLFIQE